MTETTNPEIGSVGWIDLTVEEAPAIKDFYASVTGWQASHVSMGDYDDFNMSAPGSGESKAGICHAKGGNAGLPAQWLIYITVADVDASAARCEELGGSVLSSPKNMGEMGRYCVIQDPAGAVAALFAFS